MSLRTQILEASREIVKSEGYGKLSMRRIARSIDISATSIYLHFRNKEHLLHTLMEESIGELHSVMRMIAESGEDPVVKITEISRSYVRFGLEQSQEYEILFLMSPEEMPRYPKGKFREARAGYELLAGVIREGVEAGIFDEPDPRLAAYVIWAHLHGVVAVILGRRLDTRIPENDFIDKSINDIVKGLTLTTGSSVNRSVRR